MLEWFVKTVSRSAFILLMCWMLGIVSPNRTTAADRPNVVIVLTDDQGYGDLAVHGHPFVRTPNLDRLHRESVRLTDFHVMPLCAPSRAMLMTGRNPLSVGIWATVLGRSILPADSPTLPQLFAANGYATGMFGKWHLGDNAPARPQDKGFQTAFYHGGGGVGQTPDYWGNKYQDDSYFRNGTPEKATGYCTDVWFGAAREFISRQKKANRPFLAYIATNAPHSPYIPPADLADSYRDVPGIDKPTAAYYAMIENIDTQVGLFRQFLIDQQLDQNTIFIFMTDNGTAQGLKAPGAFNAGMRAAKGTLYEGGHRVPCFIRWPAGELPKNGTGRDVKQLTSGVDILPTLASLCRLDWSSIDRTRLDGLDLTPALRGELDPRIEDRTIYVQFSQADNAPVKKQAAVLRNKWRLVNEKELYDIETDPAQKQNLLAKHPEIADDLRASHARWYDSIEPSFVNMNRIWIGSDLENPARLNAMDWHTGGTPAGLAWDQTMIRNGLKGNGFWALDVRKAGVYEIELLRWPVESGIALGDTVEGGKAWPIASAKISIAGQMLQKQVNAEEKSVKFELKLEPGPQQLQSEFLDAQQKVLGGAYYATIRLK